MERAILITIVTCRRSSLRGQTHAERAQGTESEGDGTRHGRAWDAWGWKPGMARGVRDEGATHGGSWSMWVRMRWVRWH